MLRITDNKGFQLTFANGNTVSVQFGPGNYHSGDRWNFDNVGKPCEEKDAEVAAWSEGGHKGCSTGLWYNFGCDQAQGYLTADEVLSFMLFVATSDLSKDRWDNPRTVLNSVDV